MTATIVGFTTLIIAIIGWYIWFKKSGPTKPWSEFGRHVFFAAFLAFCLGVTGQIASCSAGTTPIHIGK